MKLEDFIGYTVDELLALKRNSFSRNIIKQNSDIQTHEELMRIGHKNGTNGELIAYLFVCKNLTIHALDEKESPIPFSVFDSVYRNAVFVLQYLKKKNSYVLTLFRNKENVEDLQTFFTHTYFSGSNALKADHNVESFNSLLDFGFIKCAMTLQKTYGIQDLLEVAWQKFNGYGNEKYLKNQTSVFCASTPARSGRFVFNVEHPELSTETIYADCDLTLFGKTKIIRTDIDKISQAIAFLDRQYNIITKGKENGSSRTE